jgi:hypothetical protein
VAVDAAGGWGATGTTTVVLMHGRQMVAYDRLVYTPLQIIHMPLFKWGIIPRSVTVFGHTVTVVTANRITFMRCAECVESAFCCWRAGGWWGDQRTCLIFPYLYFMKVGMYDLSMMCMVLHDYGDHLDGIVAKVLSSVCGCAACVLSVE